MENQDFVSFLTDGNGQTVKSEHFFRKDKVNYFGITEKDKGGDNHRFDVRITYETSDASSDTFLVIMPDTTEFELFRDQMLDTQEASAEELDKIRNGLLHADAPEKPGDEPAFVARDCLEITGGAEEFFKWLHGKFFNSEKIGYWSFKTVPGTQDEDFIVCHKPNTATSPAADVHIAFRNHFQYAIVCGIVVNDHYTPDDVGFNLLLHEFVRDILRPHADYHKITYRYAGTPNEQPPKSNGTPENTNTDTLDSLEITGEAEGFYAFLLAKVTYPDIGGKWSVNRDDTKFTCTRTDADATNYFTVTLSFASNGRYAKVTAIEAIGTYLDADRYNRFLRRFVSELVKPYAEIQKLTYKYSGKC